MISDYQESTPSDKKFSPNEIDNLYDGLILKFPDLKYVGSLINMNKIDGRTYTSQIPTKDRTVRACSRTGYIFHPSRFYI